MRIIPKKTKVELELFKGIGIIDVAVGLLGVALLISIILSDLPWKTGLAVIVLVIFTGLIIPVDEEKGYMMIYHSIIYLARHKEFDKETAKPVDSKEKKGIISKITDAIIPNTQAPSVYDITPFTGVDGNFIEYAGAYYGIVVEIPSVEFRFYTVQKQDNMIDHVYGSILRTVYGTESAAMVKLDRPIIYDQKIVAEEKKLVEIKEAFLNGLINEDELTKRVEIIQDRITKIKNLNTRDKVYDSFHYLVFFHKDKQTLLNQARDMVSTMSTSDMDCHILSEKELVVFLKYNYTQNFDEHEVDNMPKDKYMDWILPKHISMSGREVRYDDLITHTFRVKDYPTLVANAWGYQLFNTMGTRVVLKMRPIERYKAVKQIDRAVDEIRSQLNDTGKASKVIELQTHFDTLTSVLSTLQGDNETLFEVNIYVTLYDYEKTKREENAKKNINNSDEFYTPFKKRIKRQLAEENFKTTDMFMQQFEAYASSHISAYDAFKKESRGIHSTSIAAAFPYVFKTLNDEGGVCIGNSAGIPVFIDFFKRDRERVNSNMVVIGKSGSGKSYATKTLLANLAAENSKIFILDPENEYYEMAHNFDGKIIDVGSATQGRLNPFHIISSLEDEEGVDEGDVSSSYSVHLQFLEEFFKQILPGMDSDAREYLNNIIVRMYDEKGIDEYTDLSKLTPEDYPIFDDLYEKILNDYQYSQGEYSKTNLRTLLNYISKFASGGRNALLWNGPASVDTIENFIVFNFQSLLANKNNTIANAQMLLVLKWLDNEIIKNRDYNIKYGADRKIIIVIDEAHVFIDSKFPIALDFMYQLAKRIRKYNGMQIIITQNIKDFVGTEELARKSTAIINACQYSFIFPLAPNDMHDLCKLYEKAGAINESEQEDIINNGRGRAFVVTAPSERTCVNIVAEEGIERLFKL